MLGEIAISACRSIFEKENKLLANWIWANTQLVTIHSIYKSQSKLS